MHGAYYFFAQSDIPDNEILITSLFKSNFFSSMIFLLAALNSNLNLEALVDALANSCWGKTVGLYR
jgi:hypothetical protein